MSTGSFHSGPPNRCNHRIIDGTSPAGPRSHIGLGAAPRPRRHPVRSSRRNDAAEFAPFALQERPPPPPRHGTFLPCTIVACRNGRAIDVTVLPIEAGDFGHATVHRCRRVGNRVGGVSSEWGYDDTGGTVGRSVADRGNGDAMGVAVDCDGG